MHPDQEEDFHTQENTDSEVLSSSPAKPEMKSGVRLEPSLPPSSLILSSLFLLLDTMELRTPRSSPASSPDHPQHQFLPTGLGSCKLLQLLPVAAF